MAGSVPSPFAVLVSEGMRWKPAKAAAFLRPPGRPAPRDDWYVRVWKTSYKKLMDCLDVHVSIHVEGKITKWQKGEGYGVVIEAEVIELL